MRKELLYLSYLQLKAIHRHYLHPASYRNSLAVGAGGMPTFTPDKNCAFGVERDPYRPHGPNQPSTGGLTIYSPVEDLVVSDPNRREVYFF